jgi:hypothetical protein
METKMTRLRTVAAVATLCLAAAPAALASTSSVGSSSGTPTANICPLSISCTYVNYKRGKPTDTIKYTGTLSSWSLNAGSVGGQVQLRILQPAGHGKLEFVQSSSWQTVTSTGKNTFAANIKVKAGDVLALTNSASGIYMATAPSGTCVQYFMGSVSNGSTGKPSHASPELELLLSANVKH